MKYQRRLRNMQYVERLGLIFRRDPGSEFLLTECGQWFINAYYPNKTTHLSPCDEYKYLRMDAVDVHRMVARTWCYNPCPRCFQLVDHIDGNSHNNAASNLRWVNHGLNSLNKKRKLA